MPEDTLERSAFATYFLLRGCTFYSSARKKLSRDKVFPNQKNKEGKLPQALMHYLIDIQIKSRRISVHLQDGFVEG
ncbi:hypothetical protein D3Z36_03370 [Lachnospiraceae bacterium]|nr:hypothetical protein [Lachnospiraceae bacterium]